MKMLKRNWSMEMMLVIVMALLTPILLNGVAVTEKIVVPEPDHKIEPVWTHVSSNWLGVHLGRVGWGGGVFPAFADIDNDGDYDLAVGDNRNYVHFFRNDGTDNSSIWTYVSSNWLLVSLGWGTAPAFADIDNDGDYDLAVGSVDVVACGGYVYFFRNDGTSTNPIWKHVTSNWLPVRVGLYASPAFADIDNDGDYDLAVGNRHGNVRFFRNDGTNTSPIWIHASPNWLPVNLGWGVNTAPAFADINNDGIYDLAVGIMDIMHGGYVHFFRNDALTVLIATIIDDIVKIIEREKAAGFNMTGAKSLLIQAEQALAHRDFNRAYKLARNANLAIDINKHATIVTIIEEIVKIIQKEKAQGFNMNKAESFLAQAEQALAHGDYDKAFESARRANSLALDIDQDGVLNHRDFAPTIYNNHIYIGTFVFIVGLMLGISSYSRKKRAEREEIERRKREEERQREQRQMAEREEIERRKREEERQREQRQINEIRSLISETQSIIQDAIKKANNAQDSLWLSVLKILEQELDDFAEEFEKNKILYKDVKNRIMNLKEQAETLSIPPVSEEPGKKESQETYYDILGVNHDASQDEIKEAHRNKIKEYHPDKVQNLSNEQEWVKKTATEMSKKINEAYEVLKDPVKRKEYDKTIRGGFK